MFIQYPLMGFNLAVSGFLVSTIYHQTRTPAQLIYIFFVDKLLSIILYSKCSLKVLKSLNLNFIPDELIVNTPTPLAQKYWVTFAKYHFARVS